jgi:anti-sigma regulatory factor (Ser/Thr protein kinase)
MDAVTLTIPNERRFYGVLRHLVGGLAARLELGYEQMDDLQLAVETALLSDAGKGTTITLEAALADGRLEVRLGPLDEQALATRLADSGEALGLERVLSTLAEDVEVFEREGTAWLQLRSSQPTPA